MDSAKKMWIEPTVTDRGAVSSAMAATTTGNTNDGGSDYTS